MASFTAAVVQAAAVGFDSERGLEKVARLARQARDGGASLAVFPEAFLPAYPRGITFGAVVGDRTRDGRDHFVATSTPQSTSPDRSSIGSSRSRPRPRCTW